MLAPPRCANKIKIPVVWVPSAACASPACAARTRLDPAAPGAFQGSGGPEVSISYGDSSIRGAAGTSTVRLSGTLLGGRSGSGSGSGGGGGSGAAASVEFSQPIVLATSISGGALGNGGGGNQQQPQQQRAPWDGLIGMGREALAARWMRPPLLSLADQRRAPAAAFGLYLAHDATAVGRGGELALGGPNPARMRGPVNWWASRLLEGKGGGTAAVCACVLAFVCDVADRQPVACDCALVAKTPPPAPFTPFLFRRRVPVVPSPAGSHWQGFWSVAIDAIRLSGGDSSDSGGDGGGSSGDGSSSSGGSKSGGGGGGAPETVLCERGCVGAFDSGTGLMTGAFVGAGPKGRFPLLVRGPTKGSMQTGCA